MTTTAQKIPLTESFLSRSQNWLKGNPKLEEVKRALAAIVARVHKGELVVSEDTCNTADALTEFYVDHGGDMVDLPSLDAPVITPADTNSSPIRASEPDYGSLYPDVPVGKPLSRDEKQAVLTDLKSVLRRPEGM